MFIYLFTAYAEWANFEPVPGREKVHREVLWTPDEFTHVFEDGMFDQAYACASEYRERLMERFAAGTRKFKQVCEWHSHADSEPPRRADGYAYHAASSRRIRISDGPSLWDQGQVVFAPPPSQKVARTSPQSGPSGLFHFGGRVQAGLGEAGTGFSVSAPG
jgi:hypothetical protein